MTPRSSIVPIICFLAVLCFAAGMIVQGLFLDSRIDKRLKDYEDYIVAKQRTRDAKIEALANTVDSLCVECAVNRACWIRMAVEK